MGRTAGHLTSLPTPQTHVPEYDRSLLITVGTMARYMRVSEETIRKWIRRHGFPAGKLPGGCWVSSTALIDLWILARNPLAPKKVD